MEGSHLSAVSVLLPNAIPTTDEVGSAPEWRAVSQYPGRSPVDMAIEAGVPAIERCGIPVDRFDWLVHAGSGPQGTRSWAAHHAVQAALIGAHGNALELRQFCAGGLTSWLVADGMRRGDRAVVCTAADNWSWTDRFAASRRDGGEPGADVASAAVIGPSGFARIIGHGNASRPEHAEAWRSDDRFWRDQPAEEYRRAYATAMSRQTVASVAALVALIREAITAAIDTAGIGAADVTHFVPPSSRSGEPYRHVARALGLPWDDGLYRFHLDHGYLSVSAPAAAMLTLCRAGALTPGAVVLLVATEYNISATAVALRIVATPTVAARDSVTVAH
jgi:3-oxoacyl-[acyl-carrier-protein] synthase III